MAQVFDPHDVFLSSAFRDFTEQRRRICALDPGRIWAVENQRPDLDQTKGASPFFIVDQLLAQIRQSRIVVCVLRDRYGTSVFGDAEENESVSFLETEIYQAAVFHNNVRIFLMEPFSPSEKLKGLLDLVRVLRPGLVPDRARPERVILDQIKRLLDSSGPTWRRASRLSVRSLVGRLALRRDDPNAPLEFLDGTFRTVRKMPDREHIRFLLEGLAGEESIEKRLTRTWIAIRELGSAPYNDAKFKEYLPLWNDVLGVWSSAAAWYGLHGHLYAGRLAAVNSQLVIRSRMESTASRNTPNYIQGTKGARASEYYSIAKLMPNRAQREHYLDLAEQDIGQALQAADDEPAGFLSIRGHIRFHQGRIENALEDFTKARELSERRGPGAVAETDADLALVYLRQGDARKALRMLRESAAALENANRPNFAIRVRKRLAFALLKSGRPFQAWRELESAYEMASDRQVFDQITPTMELVHWLGRQIGR